MAAARGMGRGSARPPRDPSGSEDHAELIPPLPFPATGAAAPRRQRSTPLEAGASATGAILFPFRTASVACFVVPAYVAEITADTF